VTTTHLAVNAVALAPGGGLTYLVNQAAALEEVLPDWRCTYFVDPSCHGQLRRALRRHDVRAPFRRSPSLPRRLVWEQFELPRLVDELGVDVLYNVAGFLAFRSGVPQVLFNQNPNHHASRHEIGLSVTLAISKLQRRVALASVRRAARVVYATHAFASELARVGFPPPDEVIASGVALDLEPGPPARADVGRPYALAVHNWYRHKRLPWLVETWRDDPGLAEVDLVVVGQPVDAHTTRELRRIVDALPGDGHIRVVEGASRAEVATLYRGAAYYISASVLEAFPQTPFEAMSFDVPCVLSDIATHREVAADAAVYFSAGDAASLVSALHEAGRARPQLVERGRRRIRDFPWAANAERFAQVFRDARDSTRRTSPA
jgi:glycosyltransferase involved in cell wall biosynthesis